MAGGRRDLRRGSNPAPGGRRDDDYRVAITPDCAFWNTRLLIVPVVLGQGTRLFADVGPDIALDLVDSRADSQGVTIQVYRPNGRMQYAD